MDKEDLAIPTPFGKVEIPLPKIPRLESPKMDERRSKALAHALGQDLSMIIALVPLVGDIAADALEDAHFSELRKNLTPTELETFIRYDKVSPSVLACLRTFMEEE